MKQRALNILIFLAMLLIVGCNNKQNFKSQKEIDEYNKYINETYPGWRILSLKDLYKADKDLWQKNRGNNKYPGIAIGKFDDTNENIIGLLIVHIADNQKNIKLILVNDKRNKSIVLYEADVGNFPVIYTLPPGKFADFYDTTKIYNIKHECIAYEVIESSVRIFYFDEGLYKSILYLD
jgi:hypothetical protein